MNDCLTRFCSFDKQLRLFESPYVEVNKEIVAEFTLKLKLFNLTESEKRHLSYLLVLFDRVDLKAIVTISGYIAISEFLKERGHGNEYLNALRFFFKTVIELTDYEKKYFRCLLAIERKKHRFQVIDQPIINGFIEFLRKVNYSPININNILQEGLMLEQWMTAWEIGSLEQIGENRLQMYLESKNLIDAKTKRRKFFNLLPLFRYYKRFINPNYEIPYVPPIPKHKYLSPISIKEIEDLLNSLKSEMDIEASLMLVLLLELGINLGELATVKLKKSCLYFLQSSKSRTDPEEREIPIIQLSKLTQSLSNKYLILLKPSDYLFFTERSLKYTSPPSKDYISVQLRLLLKKYEIKASIKQLQKAYLKFIQSKRTLIESIEDLRHNQHSARWKVYGYLEKQVL